MGIQKAIEFCRDKFLLQIRCHLVPLLQTAIQICFPAKIINNTNTLMTNLFEPKDGLNLATNLRPQPFYLCVFSY